MAVPEKDISVAALAKKSYLVPSQKRQIQESVAHLNFMMKDPETREVAMPNTDRIAANLQKDMQMLEEGTPPDYDALTKNKLNSLRRKLEEDIRHGMPTADMQERPTPNNIDLHIWWERENVQRIAAWKAVCRSLDPNNDEPNFTNIARLRPSTPPTGNPRKYWQNFDAITWEKDIEAHIDVAIDDDTYRVFLELKLADWAPANIKRELGMNDAMYDAAMDRLRSIKARSAAEKQLEVVERNNGHSDTLLANSRQLQSDIEATGLSVVQFAKHIGVHYNTVYRIVKGQSLGTDIVRSKIEKALAELTPAEGDASAISV